MRPSIVPKYYLHSGKQRLAWSNSRILTRIKYASKFHRMFCARILAVISALTVLAMAQTAPNATILPLPPFATPLSHSGRWLTDAQGRAVIYKGINVAYKLPPYTPQAQGFTEEDAAVFAREGFAGMFRNHFN